MSNEFKIRPGESNESAAVARVGGRLDAKNAQELMKWCRQQRDQGYKRMVINLSGISFVASSGVGTLLALTEEFQDVGGSVHLVSLSEAVRSVVELLNLTQFLQISDSETEAMAALGV